MKKYKNILILEAGGPCAISCLKILKKHPNLRLIAADMSQNAPGLQMADIGVIVPSATDPNFAFVIESIIKQYEIDLVLPCFEFGYKQLSTIKGPFAQDFKSAIRCKDKYEFSKLCQQKSLPHPRTQLLSEIKSGIELPVYIKPRYGVGSRNNFSVNNSVEFKLLKQYLELTKEEYLVQEMLFGEHWNVDVLVDKGKFIKAIPRKDLVQKAGNCITVEIQNYLPLIDFASLVQKKLEINSPFNLEVFESTPGSFIINEINVRFGGGIIFSALAGADLVSSLVDPKLSDLSSFKEGVFSRYYAETPIYTNQIRKGA